MSGMLLLLIMAELRAVIPGVSEQMLLRKLQQYQMRLSNLMMLAI